ncbi:MAG: response regulator, partial [Alphaproteobacteria bacterium]|nr:response regulator [Alphaproteobacteria bacterium]
KRLVVAMGGEIGIADAPGGGSVFWFTIPAVVHRPAVRSERRALAHRTFAIATRNAVLREGLTAHIRSAGGEVISLPGWRPEQGQIDALLVDAGPAAEPDLPALPRPGTRSFVLIVPEARSHLPRLRELGYSDYLVKPLRHTSLAERLNITPPGPVPPIASAEIDPPSAPADHAAQHTSKYRILLAEDNAINTMLMRDLLQRRGHTVLDVASGEAALEISGRERFDIILMDIHMPGMDGVETTRRLRKRETALGRPRTPIVALTADAVETGKHACQDAGMDGFLTKPVDPAELDSTLCALIGMCEAPAEAAA